MSLALSTWIKVYSTGINGKPKSLQICFLRFDIDSVNSVFGHEFTFLKVDENKLTDTSFANTERAVNNNVEKKKGC